MRWQGLLCWLFGLFTSVAMSHELAFAELRLHETAAGEFSWNWVAHGPDRRAPDHLVPRWPEDCQARLQHLSCASGRLAGEVAIEGLGGTYSAAVLGIRHADGQETVHTLTAARPAARIAAAGPDPRGAVRIGLDYVELGIGHILGGIDHLFFVISLLFLVGFRRQLIATLTAFTLAHSLTLVLSALDWLVLRSAPVEACIALSIVLVCREALNPHPTLARRWPALVALLFGLVHGLGLSGALKEVGLPADHLSLALFGFNVGVELGQLLIVLLAWLVLAVFRRARWRAAWRLAGIYAIGAVSAFWTLDRLRVILS